MSVEWMPIETAPKDGTDILLYFSHRNIVIRGRWGWAGEGNWESGIEDWQKWCTDNDVIIQEDMSYTPDLWLPIPKVPTGDYR